MVFSSLEFIFIFLPLFLILYYTLPSKFKNLCLLIGSLVFYSYGTMDNPLYILLLIISLAINYILGINMKHFSKYKKLWLLTDLYNFYLVVSFKYANFIFASINKITRLYGHFHQRPYLCGILYFL